MSGIRANQRKKRAQYALFQKVCYETGKPAQTEYNVVEFAADNTARVVLKPITGRSHQLRV
ncbi:pseudouridine synthase, partial [Salmonella enterica subsp. enterica serovar Anatum]|nr:pseudouridine synthase [Salmonella enterica subsp. enterica serovar Anatum]